MANFTSFPGGGRGHPPSDGRTLTWIHDHAPRPDTDFYSPSSPPSPLDESVSYTTGDSDAESSRSLPPRMVLRYPDGRDIKISHDYQNHKPEHAHTPTPVNHVPSRHSSAQGPSHLPALSLGRGSSHSRSKSGPAPPPRIVTTATSSRVMSGDRISRFAPQTGPIIPQPQPSRQSRPSFVAPHARPHATSLSPISSQPIRPHTVHPLSIRPQEAIHIFPTDHPGSPQAALYAPAQPSRNPMIQPQVHHSSRPPLASPIPQRAFTPLNHTLLQAPQVAISQSQPQPSTHIRNSPAPIVHSQSHPPSKYSKNAYSHSRIVSSNYSSGRNGHGTSSTRHMQHSRARSGSGIRSQVPTASSRDSWSMIDDEEARVGRRRESRTRRPHYRHREDSSSISSESPQTPSSNSMYYVQASPESKVKPLSPEKSIYTATSTTRSPNSPHGPSSQWSGRGSGGLKKPFFSWLFGGNNEKKNVRPGPGSKNLFRRHSIGGGPKRS